jgi:hypothetical protein
MTMPKQGLPTDEGLQAAPIPAPRAYLPSIGNDGVTNLARNTGAVISPAIKDQACSNAA